MELYLCSIFRISPCSWTGHGRRFVKQNLFLIRRVRNIWLFLIFSTRTLCVFFLLDAAPLNVTGGLFQIGIAASTFLISSTLTKLDNFRPGYFCLQIREIGFYADGATFSEEPMVNKAVNPSVVEVLSKREMLSRRPLLLKIILPLSKVFFSEQR